MYSNAKANFSLCNYPVESRLQLTIGGEVYHRPFLFIFDLPDKRPWPYRKLRRLSDRTKRRKVCGGSKREEKDRKGSGKGRERRANPRLLTLLKATWQPDTVILTDVVENIERQREGFRVVKKEGQDSNL